MADENKLRAVEAALREGGTLKEAAQRAGISEATLRNWRRDPDVARRIEAAQRGVVAPSWGDVAQASADDAPSSAVKHSDTTSPLERIMLAPTPYERLMLLDEHLVTRGFHPMSAWWRFAFERFYASGKRWFVARVGRRGGKSSDVCRAAVCEAIFTERVLSPGDVGIFSVLSIDMAEATGRMNVIERILQALGYAKVEGTPQDRASYSRNMLLSRPRIQLQDAAGHDIEFRVYPAAIGGVSGHTSIGSLCDEAAKWRDEKTAANPAAEVLRSLMPAMATQVAAYLFLVSSAFSTLDAHHDAIDEGDTARQHIARLGEHAAEEDRVARIDAAQLLRQQASSTMSATERARLESAAKMLDESAARVDPLTPNIPTWIPHPALTIVRTMRDEPDLPTWLREYASEPMGSGDAAFFDHAVVDAAAKLTHDAAIAERGHGLVLAPKWRERFFCGIDPGLDRDAFGCAVIGLAQAEGLTPLWWLADAMLLEPRPGAPLDPDDSFDDCAKVAVRWGCKEWATDIHYVANARKRGAFAGLATILQTADPGTVGLRVRRAFGRGVVALGGHPLSQMVARQIKSAKSRAGDGATVKLVFPRIDGIHADLASAVLRALWLAGAGGGDGRTGAGPMADRRIVGSGVGRSPLASR